DVTAALDRAWSVAVADDEVPIDEPRAEDGEVAQCASLVRQTLAKAPAKRHRALNSALAALLRRLGPAERQEADALYRQLRAADPSHSGTHWDHALLLKHTGRFEEGLAALEAYAKAGGVPDQAFHWNTGICATGAGLGQKALDAWLAEKVKI